MKRLDFEMLANEPKADRNDVNNHVSEPAPLPVGSGPWAPSHGLFQGQERGWKKIHTPTPCNPWLPGARPRLRSCKETVGGSSQEKEPVPPEMGLKSGQDSDPEGSGARRTQTSLEMRH